MNLLSPFSFTEYLTNVVLTNSVLLRSLRSRTELFFLPLFLWSLQSITELFFLPLFHRGGVVVAMVVVVSSVVAGVAANDVFCVLFLCKNDRADMVRMKPFISP